MGNLLIKIFIKDYDNVMDNKVRQKYGNLVGWTGIVSNLFLFGVKLIVGIILNSVSIMADSFNNLSDSVTSIITLISFKLSSKPADKEHPFGHGRAEYIASFIVAFAIMLLGYEFLKSSVEKIRNPEELAFNIISVSILILSIGVKIWLSIFNKNVGKKINSQTLIATAVDSRNDVIITSVTVISVVFTHFTGLIIDGYVGVVVALFLLYSGYNLAKETLSPLLGESPDPELVKNIKNKILSFDGIIGVHDIIVHNYGPNHIIATIHAEVPSDMDIAYSHEVIDRAEKEVREQLGVLLVIHMDPIQINDERLTVLKEVAISITKAFDERMHPHDFRIVDSADEINFIFELQIPHDYNEDINKLIDRIEKGVKEINKKCHCIISVEKGFY